MVEGERDADLLAKFLAERFVMAYQDLTGVDFCCSVRACSIAFANIIYRFIIISNTK